MTVKDVIEKVEELRPGSQLSFEESLRHIRAVEASINSNIICCYEGVKENPLPCVMEDELIVPDMYASLYCNYLAAQIDIINGDVTRYSNNMILYNTMLSAYCDWFLRKFMPLQKGKVRWR